MRNSINSPVATRQSSPAEILAHLRWKAKRELARREFGRQWRTSFEAFCGGIDIVTKSGERTKLDLNPIQRRYCAARTPRDIVLKPRQIGFTTLELARDVWTLLTRPGARVVVVVQSLTGHGPLKQLSGALRVMFESLRNEGLEIRFRTESLAEWVLADGDGSLRIVEAGASEAAAEKKGRSGTITRLHLTETAFYEYADETLNALLECVPSADFGSEIVVESTPNGAGGWYFEQYVSATKGDNGYRAHFFPWFDQAEYGTPLEPGETIEPRTERETELFAKHGISPEQLKWYRAKLAAKTADLTDQEYPTDSERCFLVSGRGFFDKAITAALMSQTREPIRVELAGALRIWEMPRAGASYVVVADPSEGTGGDPGAAIVFDRQGKHVATVHGQFQPWPFGELLVKTALMYNGATVVIERNNHGHAVIQSVLAGQKYPQERVYRAPDGKFGWLTNEVARSSALDALEEAHRTGFWVSPDARVVAEQRTFVVTKHGKAEASRGSHDDLILASAIGWDVLRKPLARRNLNNLPAA